MSLENSQNLGALVLYTLTPELKEKGIIPRNFEWNKINTLSEAQREYIQEYLIKKINEIKGGKNDNMGNN